MKGVLWSFVSAVAVVLQGATDVPIQPNFDVTKLKGRWHAIAFVLDRGEPKHTLGSIARMRPAAGGDLLITSLVPQGRRCKKQKVTLFSTDEPGKFVTLVESVVRVVETDYRTYCIHHVETRGERINALHLYTKKLEVSDALKEKYKMIASSLGFSTDKIIYLSRPDPCLK